MTIDAQEFRHVLGHFATGVTIITTQSEERPIGFTANAFTSVSLDPPLVLVCIGNTNSSLAAVLASGVFVVNVLAAEQEDLARVFAKNGPAKNAHFANIVYQRGSTGVPILADDLAWIECRIYATHPAGDHIIVIGEVVALGSRPGTPLVFADGHYVTLPAPTLR